MPDRKMADAAKRWGREAEAARRILQVSTELHLTWFEFDNALKKIKELAYISDKAVMNDERGAATKKEADFSVEEDSYLSKARFRFEMSLERPRKLDKKIRAAIRRSWCTNHQVLLILRCLTTEYQEKYDQDAPLIKELSQHYRDLSQGRENCQ